MKTFPPKAFTLVEMMVAMSIMLLVITGTTQFFINTYKMTFVSNKKMLINSDIRKITNEMSEYAKDATYGLVYSSFYSMTGGDFRNPASGMLPEDYQLRDDETGDLLVLVYYGLDSNPADTIRPPITRLVGYYRSVDDPTNNLGPVRKFDIDIPSDKQDLDVEDLIPDESTQDEHEIVLQFSRGLADEHLFYNFRSRAIMVNGQIYHGNDAKRVTDTYNFTITPRGPRGNESL